MAFLKIKSRLSFCVREALQPKWNYCNEIQLINVSAALAFALFFSLVRGYVMQYTALHRMVICIMLIYDFGRGTVPYRKTLLATSKDPCIETHVIALEEKTEIQLTQKIFWSDACSHRHQCGNRLLWKSVHPHNRQLKHSLGAQPGKQLTGRHRHGQRQEAGLRRGHIPPARLTRG